MASRHESSQLAPTIQGVRSIPLSLGLAIAVATVLADSSVVVLGLPDIGPDEIRVGWPAYFRPFIDRRLVFVYDDVSGQAMTRAEADSLETGAPAGPAGEASASTT